MEIAPYTPVDEAQVLALSLRAWAPVFEKMRPAVPDYVYRAFYPAGWAARQAADISSYLASEDLTAFVVRENGRILGWIGLRTHPEDRMGEIHILAVDPDAQQRGVARALMDHALAFFRAAGLEIALVETGDDPGHQPSRATYEALGFERWPVARYFRKL
ncbi:GNAT family N-acetyltransferase [Caulobacter mirabilis]|uniref:GNAT family N-acetyltransferase n=1 Tax=Caulobacter mirabilis TaxID=69666 RepID=A0A2D2AUS8_9CAUL|nr:GNAT family N-acetyltransferase [Caulobacter mirabilis]ATQ41760.1 GNAT family N-acetyltransferase [Caulobacter mirabilis]